jgi:hypothetical protein
MSRGDVVEQLPDQVNEPECFSFVVLWVLRYAYYQLRWLICNQNKLITQSQYTISELVSRPIQR